MRLRSPLLGAVCLGLVVAAPACATELGECDLEAAFEIAYTADGSPAFVGQALVIQSCGGGGFCHAEGLAPSQRFGAPAALTLDLRIAATTRLPEAAAVARLRRAQDVAAAHRWPILDTVLAGTMPPGGAAGAAVLGSTPSYDRVGEDGRTFSALPAIGSDDGVALLRNWLACGVPVVERTEPVPEGEVDSAGFPVAACVRRCVDPVLRDIEQAILRPSCATAACHDDDAPAAGLDLSLPPGDAPLDRLLTRLTVQSAAGEECIADPTWAGRPMVVPGDPEGSFLFHKTAPSTGAVACGRRMPLARSLLGPQATCALEAWIRCGACGPEDGTCDACVDQARTVCGVRVGPDGMATCQDTVRCPRFALPPPE
jgi:hypothetical protein